MKATGGMVIFSSLFFTMNSSLWALWVEGVGTEPGAFQGREYEHFDKQSFIYNTRTEDLAGKMFEI